MITAAAAAEGVGGRQGTVEGVQFTREHDERTGFDELVLWEESAAADSQRRAAAVFKAAQGVDVDGAGHGMRNISLWAFITGACAGRWMCVGVGVCVWGGSL